MKPILHIGHLKTSTTSLQEGFFSDEELFYPLGRFGLGGDTTRGEVVRELIWEGIYLDDLNYNKRVENYSKICNYHLEISINKVKLFLDSLSQNFLLSNNEIPVLNITFFASSNC